jgi:hypothetical protein
MNIKKHNALIYEEDGDSHYTRIDEAGLSRIFETLANNDIDFVIISGFRNFDEEGKKLSYKQNKQRNNQLIRNIRSNIGEKIGAYRMIGKWVECSKKIPEDKKLSDCASIGGTLIDSMEESWLIPNATKNKDFFEVCRKEAEKYSQDAFIARNNKDFGVFLSSGKKEVSFKEVTKETIKDGIAAIKDIQGYSINREDRRKKGNIRSIVFKDENEKEPEQTSGERTRIAKLEHQIRYAIQQKIPYKEISQKYQVSMAHITDVKRRMLNRQHIRESLELYLTLPEGNASHLMYSAMNILY